MNENVTLVRDNIASCVLKKRTVASVRLQTVGEEIANSVLHGFGAVLAAVGFVPLILRACGFLGGTNGGTRSVVSCIIYAVTIFVMFMASTLYHAISHIGVKKILRVLDHSAIYLLIAGTYTPICLIVLPRGIGLTLFLVEWTFAAAGITFHALNFKFLKKIEVLVYCIMGWAIATAATSLQNMPPISIALLIAGGAAYTIGVIFYKKPHKKHCHVIWHIFVLAAAVCHWFAVFIMA
ncbi:MAG: hemolysin III family protein [Termitinemataceae bacterium]|nr:MAG: hemolysin III family protein [Termitinemataceae bacterium]